MSLDLLERLLALCGVKLRAVVEMIADADARGLAALAGTTFEERVPESCRWLVTYLGDRDLRWGGGLAACLQGAPVHPHVPVLAVTVDEIDVLARLVRDDWWCGRLDAARLRIDGRVRGRDWSGRRFAEIVLLQQPARERHIDNRVGHRQRLIALEDLTAQDVDPRAVEATLRTGRLDDWKLQEAAPITGRELPSTYDPRNPG